MRPNTITKALAGLQKQLKRYPLIEAFIDPGACTGWAIWLTPQELDPVTTDRFHVGQGPWREVLEMLENLLANHADRFTLTWEDYVVTAGRPGDPVALRVIGALEYLCYRHRHSDLLVTTPRPAAARRVGVAKLANVGWHSPGLRDANQAASHLLAALLVDNRLPAELVARVVPPGVADGDG